MFTCRSFLFPIRMQKRYANIRWWLPVNIMVWKLVQNSIYFLPRVFWIPGLSRQGPGPGSWTLDGECVNHIQFFSVAVISALSNLMIVHCHMCDMSNATYLISQSLLVSKIELGLKSPVPTVLPAGRRAASARDNPSLRLGMQFFPQIMQQLPHSV